MYKQSIDLGLYDRNEGVPVYPTYFLDEMRRDAGHRATKQLTGYGYNAQTGEGLDEALQNIRKDSEAFNKFNRNINVAHRATNAMTNQLGYAPGTNLNRFYPNSERILNLLEENRSLRPRLGRLGSKHLTTYSIPGIFNFPDKLYTFDSTDYDNKFKKVLDRLSLGTRGFKRPVLAYRYSPILVESNIKDRVRSRLDMRNGFQRFTKIDNFRPGMTRDLLKQLLDECKGAKNMKNTVFTQPLNYMSGLLKKLKGIRF